MNYKDEAPHTKLLTSSLLVMKREENGVMKIDTTVIQQPTYDEFGHVVANDRSGTAADMQYAYGNQRRSIEYVQVRCDKDMDYGQNICDN